MILQIYDSDHAMDLTAWKLYLAEQSANRKPVSFLADCEPQTIQLTPTQIALIVGENTISSNSGDVTVEYGDDPNVLVNPTEFASKPLIKATGAGVFFIGSTQITITGTATQEIYIDCDTMEIYKKNGPIITNASSLVTFNTLDFPVLEPGNTRVSIVSGISKVVITPRWCIV